MSYPDTGIPSARTEPQTETNDSIVPELERVLQLLREALRPNEILDALVTIDLDARDLADGIGVDERTVRRWLDGDTPNRNHQKAIGALRVFVIHVLQRRGLPVDLVARWLRLPDAELGFVTPLLAISEGRLADVVVAFDTYIAPRPGTSSKQLVDRDEPEEQATETSIAATEDNPTGEFSAVSGS